MEKKGKKSGNSILRAVLVGVSLLLQIGWLLLMILKLNRYSAYISLLTGVLALMVVLRLYSKDMGSAYKLPWIMLIMALPVMGLSLYLLSEAAMSTKGMGKRMEKLRTSAITCLDEDAVVMETLAKENLAVGNQFRYLSSKGQCPVYAGTAVTYFSHGAQALEAMKKDLETAENFIFMEYFIIEDGISFNEILDILIRKAKAGVDVRLMYDDIGSLGYVNWRYAAKLNQAGIKCQVFNPALPILSLFMNHRDHRKITVIDGKVGYTGGYNLADEYFGLRFPYGQWKDTGIRIEGDAVQSLTATFLELWQLNRREQENVEEFLKVSHRVDVSGYVQPFGDSPLTGERLAENAYINLIHHAKRYVWLMTPYLIITDELRRALELAAKRGVDVRIITPGVPDKKAVYAVTRSYYGTLCKAGVRIFEYSPGFLHAKQCVCDGEVALIGTSNLDFRSLYLHFENDVLLYDCPAVAQMDADFRETLAQCREIPLCFSSKTLKFWQCILRLFAPLL